MLVQDQRRLRRACGQPGRSWLLIKHRDDWAGPIDITTFAPHSVKTPDADLADILAADNPAIWHSHAPAKGGDTGAQFQPDYSAGAGDKGERTGKLGPRPRRRAAESAKGCEERAGARRRSQSQLQRNRPRPRSRLRHACQGRRQRAAAVRGPDGPRLAANSLRLAILCRAEALHPGASHIGRTRIRGTSSVSRHRTPDSFLAIIQRRLSGPPAASCN